MRGKKIALKKFFLILTIALLAFSAAGCSRNKQPDIPVGPSGKAEIFIWRATEYKDLFRPYAGTYMANNPTIQLWYTQKELGRAYEISSLDQIAADKLHVWSIPVDWMPDHLDKLLPMPDGILGEKIDNAKFMKDKLIPGLDESVYQSYTLNNKVYGLPFTIDSLILYYNPVIFDQALARWKQAHPRSNNEKPSEEELAMEELLKNPPSTWEELLQVIPLLTIRNGDQIKQSAIALGAADNVANADDIVQLLIYQNGGDIVSTDGEKMAVFKESMVKENGELFFPGREALNFYANFSSPDKDNYTWNSSMPNSVEAFVSGKTAMIIDYPSLRDRLTKEAPEFKSYQTAKMPQISESQAPVNFGSFMIEAVTNAAKEGKQSPAWGWVLSYMKTENSQAITDIIHRPSPHLSLTEARAKAEKGIISQQALTVKVPYKRRHEEFDAAFLTMIRNVTKHSQPVEDALNQTNDKINELLKSEAN